MCDGEAVSLWTVAYAGNRAASVIFDRPLGYHGRICWMLHQQLLVFSAAATDDLLLRITALLVLVLSWSLTCTCRSENGLDRSYISPEEIADILVLILHPVYRHCPYLTGRNDCS